MDLLQAIDDMPGRTFLVLYGVVILATLGMCWFWVRWLDPTRKVATPPLPDFFDPLEVAYLRGTENAVTRVLIFGLMQRGYLEIVEEKKWLSTQRRIQQTDEPPGTEQLSPVEKLVFNQFTVPLTADSVFPGLPRAVKPFCEEYRLSCESNRFVTAAEDRWAGLPPGLLGALVIVGLGGFKLLGALDEGRSNVGFLAIMGIVGTVLLLMVCWKSRLTNLGKRYLDELKNTVGVYPGQFAGPETDAATEGQAAANWALLATMAVVGMSALDGTAYSAFHSMFPKAGSGGWGGGCGGGCGGCGGGGCGGCGGD